MEKTILVTGKDTFLGNELCRHFLDEGHSVVATVNPQGEPGADLGGEDRLTLLPWAKRSAVAAKNLLMEILARDLTPQQVYLVFSPGGQGDNFADMSPSSMEAQIDETFKAYFFLAREILAWALTTHQTQLNFVFYHEDPDELPPLSGALYQGFKSLVNGIMKKYKQIPMWGFECFAPQPEAYLEFVLEHPRTGDARTTGAGRWHAFVEKKKFFSQFIKSQDSR